MVGKAEGTDTLGYCLFNIFILGARGVSAPIGVVMIVTSHFLYRVRRYATTQPRAISARIRKVVRNLPTFFIKA